MMLKFCRFTLIADVMLFFVLGLLTIPGLYRRPTRAAANARENIRMR
jgi:hypothetical protein